MAQPEARAPPPAQSVVRQFEGRPAVSAQRHSRLPPGRAAKPSGRYDWPSGEGTNKEQNSESGYTCARIRKNTAMSFTAPSHAAKEKRRLHNDKKSEPKLTQKKGTIWCPYHLLQKGGEEEKREADEERLEALIAASAAHLD